MARNYSSISEVKTLAANVPETGAGSTQVIFNEGTTGLPSVPFVLVLNPDETNEEVVLATSLTGSTYTVTRNIEGGGLKSHTVNQEVRHMIVGSDLQLVHNHLDNTTTAHGVSGAVVGTTSEQTLTLKRLTTPKINENVNLTATSTELNVLDGITASTTELNYVDGVTSSIQTQIDTKASSADPTFTGTVVLPSTTSIGTITSTELSYVDGVTSAIQTQFNNNTPVGVVNMWVTSTAPTGWLLCDGSTKSTTTNPELANLYSVIGTIYGGTDATSFRLPDLRGRVPMGAGTGRNVADSANLTARTLGAKISDAETVILTEAQLASHNHTQNSHGHSINDAGHTHAQKVTAGVSGGSGIRTDYTGDYSGAQQYQQGITTDTSGTGISINGNTATNNPTGGGQAHENTQPSTVINFIIKY
jgi:microcystin-dependent protein